MMGGSIALAALRAGHRVFLYDQWATEKIVGPKFGQATVVNDLPELVSKSRLIILATPIAALAQVGDALSELVGPHHVVSDVASVKRPAAEVLVTAAVPADVPPLLTGIRFTLSGGELTRAS